jgi:hypothetical protein
VAAALGPPMGDLERLDAFLRVGCCARGRAWRARVLQEERASIYARFLRTNLAPTRLDAAVGCVVSRGFASDLIGLNLVLVAASVWYLGLPQFWRVHFNLYVGLLVHAVGLLPAELPPARLDQRVVARAGSLFGGYVCVDTWVLTAAASGVYFHQIWPVPGAAWTGAGGRRGRRATLHGGPGGQGGQVTDPWVVATLVALAAYVGFFAWTRVWASARFPHTLGLGCAAGLAGNVAFALARDAVGHYTMEQQIMAASVSCVFLLLWLFLNIESNNANGIGVRKSEYIRVLGDIMNSEGITTMGGGDERNARLASQRARAALLRQRKSRNKQDGFVRMMAAVEQRNVERLRREREEL